LYQSWFISYQSILNADIETKTSETTLRSVTIEKLVGDTLYLKNNLDKNISVQTIKLGNVTCNISVNLTQDINEIKLTDCLDEVSSETSEILISTKDDLISKKVYINDLDKYHIDPPVISFSSNVSTVNSGESINVSWTTSNSASCTALGDWSGVKGLSGYEIINNIIANSSYTLECVSPEGKAKSTTIKVEKLIKYVCTNKLTVDELKAENDKAQTGDIYSNGVSYSVRLKGYVMTTNWRDSWSAPCGQSPGDTIYWFNNRIYLRSAGCLPGAPGFSDRWKWIVYEYDNIPIPDQCK